MGFNVIDSGMNSAMPSVSSLVTNSPDEHLHRAEGQRVSKTISIAGTGGAVTTNVFQFTGAVELLDLYGVFTDATETTTMTGAIVSVYDGTASMDLCSTDVGLTLSGATLNSFIGRVAVDGTDPAFLNADQVRISEVSARRQLIGAILNGKNGATNYVRFVVTTDANTDCEITWYATWRCLIPGSTFAAV